MNRRRLFVKVMTYRGRLYYSPGGVRILLRGSLFDLGKRSPAACKFVAREFDLEIFGLAKRGRLSGERTTKQNSGCEFVQPGRELGGAS